MAEWSVKTGDRPRRRDADRPEQAVRRPLSVHRRERPAKPGGPCPGEGRVPGRPLGRRKRGSRAPHRRRVAAGPHRGPAPQAREGVLGAGRGRAGRVRSRCAARRRRTWRWADPALPRPVHPAARALAAPPADSSARGHSGKLARGHPARRPQSAGASHDGEHRPPDIAPGARADRAVVARQSGPRRVAGSRCPPDRLPPP